MIEPMKKVAVLMSAAHLEQSLEDLRRLGMVHLTQPPSPSLPPAGEGSEPLRLEEPLQVLRDALALAPPGAAIPLTPLFHRGGLNHYQRNRRLKASPSPPIGWRCGASCCAARASGPRCAGSGRVRWFSDASIRGTF